ncbi:MAG: NUDIX domain-containing protein [Methylocystaceae bacterium]
MEKTLSKQEIFNGHIVKLSLHTVELPGGKTATREVIEHPGAVAILPIDEEDRVYLVKQFRKPLEKEILEIPAGKLNPGEDPFQCAQRELLEETGLTASSWDKITAYYTTPGFTNEFLHVYIASDLTIGTACPDEDEVLSLVVLPLAEAWRLVKEGEICDGKSIIALQRLAWQRRIEG